MLKLMDEKVFTILQLEDVVYQTGQIPCTNVFLLHYVATLSLYKNGSILRYSYF